VKLQKSLGDHKSGEEDIINIFSILSKKIPVQVLLYCTVILVVIEIGGIMNLQYCTVILYLLLLEVPWIKKKDIRLEINESHIVINDIAHK
jgi:hypothetical protein